MYSLIIALALMFAFCGVCSLLDISPLLGCMSMGMVYRNLAEDDGLFKQINYFNPPILLLFFVRSGVQFDLNALLQPAGLLGSVPLLTVGILYFLVRILGKYCGAFLGSLVVRKDPRVRNYLGLALIPQAGVAIGLAALCVLIPNPWAVANLSFQLSFGAMAGLQLLSGAVYRKITDWPPVHRALRRRFARPITKYTAATVAATCGALIFTLPLTAARLGVVSLAALGANLLALWAVSLLFELSLLACLLGAVWLAPAKLVGLACALLVRHILGVAGLMAGLPFTAVYTQNAFILPWLIFSYLVFACCFLPGGRKAVLPAACACALGLCLSLWLGWLDGGSRDLQMTMLDVGQGQCLVFTNGGAAFKDNFTSEGSEIKVSGENLTIEYTGHVHCACGKTASEAFQSICKEILSFPEKCRKQIF